MTGKSRAENSFVRGERGAGGEREKKKWKIHACGKKRPEIRAYMELLSGGSSNRF